MRQRTRPVLLVVDDDTSVLSTLDRSLRRADYDVHLAEGGDAALEAIGRIRPDLVLLDVMMPGGPDGYQVCSSLRTRSDMDLVPVIFVTGEQNPIINQHMPEIVKAAGGLFYLGKPCDGSLLVKLITEILGDIAPA